MPSTPSLRDARTEVVRERVLAGVAELLTAGDDLTFAKVAKAAGVPERTVYRHFATREALLAAVFEWANRRIGFEGDLPTDGAGVVELVRRVFPGFDEIGPVVRELLIAPEGLLARLANTGERQRAAEAVVANEVPGLDPASARRVAAALQLLTTAATWNSLRDYWDMDGPEAAETAALAIELLLDGARARAAR
ncbi:MAG TPA: TetR/AcrR family transcriptional regulator [Acidimicrobiales bacterium]|nr:TetR/AcrR family transcriptional regulator [Acidimicrobiales bacterium]